MASKGSSSQCIGFVSVLPRAMLNLSKFTWCRNMLMRHRLYVVGLISWPKKPWRTLSVPRILANLSRSEPEPHAGS